MELNTVAGSKASMNAHGPKSMDSPEMVMLSVFITPWMKPTFIHLATNAACTRITSPNRPKARFGLSAR